MNKDWVNLARHSQECIRGVNIFLDIAFSKGFHIRNHILCLCAKCKNDHWQPRNVVYNHLFAFGFVKGYSIWVHHGKTLTASMDIDRNNTFF